MATKAITEINITCFHAGVEGKTTDKWESTHFLVWNTSSLPLGILSWNYILSLKESQESQKVRSSHVKQPNSITEDKHAARTSQWNEYGALSVLFCSVVGTDSNVLILGRRDSEWGDCQDREFLDFLIFLIFSYLTVSPSKDESSEIRWIKERGAPMIGSE